MIILVFNNEWENSRTALNNILNVGDKIGKFFDYMETLGTTLVSKNYVGILRN